MSNAPTFPLPDESPKAATASVNQAQAEFLAGMPASNRQDFIDAKRGFVGTIKDAEYMTLGGKRKSWTLAPYTFLEGDEAPDTINPSLWRQAQLNMNHGLYEVVPTVYQVRGFDMANMTIVEGDTGIIIIDAMSTEESAIAAIELYREHRGDRPVVAVIITHSHADHFGGIKGVASMEDFASGRIPLIVPDQFMEHTVSENIYSGVAMRRRAMYQFGIMLEPGERGHVDNGLGKTFGMGAMGLAPPNDLIMATGDERMLDGVRMVFQLAPDTESPAQMHIYMPELKVLNMAENSVHTFHNLLPFRGAQVRNTLDWSYYLGEALQLWGGEATTLIGQHHWPTWGADNIVEFLKIQRDLYKHVHDQTLRLLNKGLTSIEIAEQLKLPKSIDESWFVRGYYGSLSHNVKAIYQLYLGWYDAVPAHLNPLTPVEQGRKMVEYMGGPDAVVAKAQIDFDKGEFRWVAQILNHVVFADACFKPARALLADTYEQLGYMAECATWRNAYLKGAQELRQGVPAMPNARPMDVGMMKALHTDQIFGMLGTRVDPQAAEGLHLVINLTFTDRKEEMVLNLENSTLTYMGGRLEVDAHLSLVLTRSTFDQVLAKKLAFPDAVASGDITFTGDITKFGQLFALFEEQNAAFAIVEP